MAETMYFQWQNEVLLKTIYPLREMKLRDFLTYYREIDLWAEYRDKHIDELKPEVEAHIRARENALVTAYKSYQTLRAYFLQEDVRTWYVSKYRLSDETELARIKELHRTFITYLPKLADVRREKYFVLQQVYAWEQYRKGLMQQVAQKQRRLNIMIPDHPKRPVETEQLQRLQNVTLAIADDELGRLYSFVSTYNKIENRRLELHKTRQSAQTTRKGLESRREVLRTQIAPLEEKVRGLTAELARLKTPPNLQTAEAYFSVEDVSGQVRSRYPKLDDGVLATIDSLHRELARIVRETRDNAVKLVSVRNQAYRFQEAKRRIERQIVALESNVHTMPAGSAERTERDAAIRNLKDTSLKALGDEFGRFNDLQGALVHASKSPAELEQMMQAGEKELLRAKEALSKLAADASSLDEQLKPLDSILNLSEEEYLVRYTPDQPITVKDIVRGKLEEYKASLAEKNHLQLLEETVQRFLAEPERFPLWLQYMVIHFSGMRYATAHGSWADPKDLLISLRTSTVEKDFRKLDDDAIEAFCQDRAASYEAANGTTSGRLAPRLARATEPQWKAKIGHHLKGLKSPSAYYRRKALFDLRMDEENYEVESMTDTDALEALEAIRDTLPDWMWKEIVRLTDLRVKEAKDPGWEKLTPAEEEEKNSARYAEFRAILNQWKQANIAGWREEHDRSSRLIVTRAVCNEVAEHIQHLRGHSPPGGLTGKAPWYMKNERESRAAGGSKPYFTRASSLKDYTVGASILWLRFVNEQPNAWRVALPLTTRNGDGLIPSEFLSKKAGSQGSWVYTQGDVLKRTRTRSNEKKQSVRDEQWLRWIHEATVAEVAETADGPIVLTFETALPYEDPRLSTIGVFKHYLPNLVYNGGEETYNGSFVGFLPEGRIPAADLEEMLDWNRILRRQVMSPAELEQYRRKHIRKESLN